MTKAEEFIVRYQIEREKLWNAQGIFRCEEQLKNDVQCQKQCDDCRLYYESKLKSK